MQNNYPFFKYITGDSKVHQMNSKMKILYIMLSILSIILVRDYISLLLLFLFIIFIIYNTKIPFYAYLKNILLLWPIYIIIFLITLIISINVSFSIILILKITFIINILLILTFTTSLSEIAWGIECLFVKLKKIKIPVTKISLKIALTIKLISSLFIEIKVVRKSMAYRGMPYNNPLLTFKKIFIPALSLSYRHVKRLGSAMKIRFYGKSSKRTNYHSFKTTKFDKLIIVLSCILLYIILFIGWYCKQYIIIGWWFL